MLGSEDQALSWLERSINEHDGMVKWVKVVPWAEPLRYDPRFQDLLRRMNFPE